jgi:two-component system chemotaxis sensor kinase CheA
MVSEQKTIMQLLDDLAVQILIVEPGDLSAVGELLEILESLLGHEGIHDNQNLSAMVDALKKVFEGMIMGEYSDSRECFDGLIKSVTILQEIERGDEANIDKFCGFLQATGFELDVQAFGVSDDGGEIDTRFLADPEMLTAFIEESGEHLAAIEDCVLELETNPTDDETINSIFRSFHTIKGIAGCTDLDDIAHLAHTTENLLDEVRNGRREMNGEAIDIALEVGDRIGKMVGVVKAVFEKGTGEYKKIEIADLVAKVNHILTGESSDAGESVSEEITTGDVVSEAENTEEESPGLDLGQDGDIPDFLQDADLVAGFVSEAFEHLEAIEVNVLELEQAPDDIDIINNIFRPFHTVKGVSGFLNLTHINKLAHTTENLLDDVRNNKIAMNADIIDIVLGVGDYLRSMVQNISDMLEQGPSAYQFFDISEWVAKVVAVQAGQSLADVDAGVAKTDSQPVAADSVSPVKETADKDSAPKPKPSEKTAQAAAASASVPPKGAVSASPVRSKKSKISASIKVDVEKLDGLVNAVGELVIMQAMVRQNPLIISVSDPKLNKDFSQLSRITSELQKTAMSMRMVPIRQTFQKMTRLVRDLSKKSGKVVDLVMEGEETEIDRNMVDSIYDPLVHMMRNSVDHGVQLPADREAVGKPGKGTVKLAAYHKGGNIIIEIHDDGQGLNTEKIKSKALERGLIAEGDHPSDHEINNMIFMPGFSTADQITDVSGRGVGMDVVKKGVEKLRGKVELISTPGEGTQFLMRLPLTLAIIDGIIVRVGQERYIIPTIAIQESMRPRKEQYKTVQGQGETLMVRDMLIPVIRLYHVFGVENGVEKITDGIVVVIENEGRQRALLVDELLGKQEVVIKSLGGYLTDIKGVAGGTILSDGRVGLILDLAGLISASDEMGSPIVGNEEF